MRELVRTAAIVALALGVSACGGSGGGSRGASGGSSSGSAAGAGSGAAGQSGASQAQWQVALAALGTSPATQPLGLDPQALALWNELVARNWPAYRTAVDAAIAAQLRSLATNLSSGSISVAAPRNVTIDTQAPPAFEGSGAGAAQTFTVHLPAAPGAWRVAFTVDVTATILLNVLGAPVTVPITIDVAVDVADVRIEQPILFDLSNPARPAIAAAGAPKISLRLSVSSQSPIVSQIAGALTQLLDPVVRTALGAGSVVAQQQLGLALGQVPQSPWGAGAPPAAAVPGAAPLEPLAVRISDDIQRDHMPFDTVLPVVFDQPGYGNGAVVGLSDYGDSAIWTGHYLAAEALRFDCTGDARALAGARRATAGLAACLDVSGPGEGLLARCVVPLASPFIADIQGSSSYYTGVANGQPTGALDHISRDQYIGAVLGLTQTYLRVPPLRAQAGPLVARIVATLDAHDWVAPEHDRVTPSAPFGQTPDIMWSFVKSANLVDRARFGALHDHFRDMASAFWVGAWTSSREVHDAYYKFNLGHSTVVNLVSTETDPALYREYVKVLEIMRDATGHHQNAWFDAVYGMAVPPAAPAVAPHVKDELDRFALRDRRAHPVANSADPTIARTTYSAPTVSAPKLVALEPLPVEKRPSTDFLWQRSPFELDSGGDPRHEYPGIDLILPYWMARAYGMMR